MSIKLPKRIFVYIIGCLILGFSYAQAFPVKPINIYLPFSKGGTSDKLIRLLADNISRDIGQKIIIISNDDPNTSSIEFINRYVSLPSDGYHLIFGNLGTHTSRVITDRQTIIYDPLVDFKPVVMLGKTPMYLMVRKDFPGDNFNEFIAHIRENPENKVTFAHSGYGSTAFLAAIYFSSILKIKTVFIPYGSSGPALKDLANGYVDAMVDQTTSALPYIRGKLVKSILITSAERSSLTPDIPTSQEVKLPEFSIQGWNMLFAPKGTPDKIVYFLNKKFSKALEDKFIRSELMLLNTISIRNEVNKPVFLKRFLEHEIKYWQAISNIIFQS